MRSRGLPPLLVLLLGAACSGSESGDGGNAGGSAGQAADAAADSGLGGTSGTGGTDGSAGLDSSAGAAGLDSSAGAAGTDAGTPATANAIWVWTGQDFVAPAERAKLLGFALARGASRLFVNGYPSLHPGSSGYAPDAWRAGLEQAAALGIGVEILIGSAEWTSPGTSQSWAIAQLIGPIAKFYADAATTTKPVALHLDVEPHGIPGWGDLPVASKQAKIADLCGFYELTRATLDQNGASGLKLHADLPSWWDSPTYTFELDGKTATGFGHALSRLDAVALMAYSNKVSNVLGNSSKEMELADPVGKPVFIGIETDPDYATDAFLTKADVESALAAIQGAYASRPAYGGWAVHAYAHWSAMQGY